MSEYAFPPGFFDRADPAPDAVFYRSPRFVQHLDQRAIAAVGDLYAGLGIDGTVVDLMSSWVSHFRRAPVELIGIGMNAEEMAANPQLAGYHVADLNVDPTLPLADGSADHAVCCVSVDYLTRPVEVFADVARVVRRGGLFVHTFSNRCFPSKAIRGWLAAEEGTHSAIVRAYFESADGWEEAEARRLLDGRGGDPLWAVWARRR